MTEDTFESKICTRCGESRPFDEFAKAATSKDGLRSECKKCQHRRRSHVSGWRGPSARLPSSISRTL